MRAGAWVGVAAKKQTDRKAVQTRLCSSSTEAWAWKGTCSRRAQEVSCAGRITRRAKHPPGRPGGNLTPGTDAARLRTRRHLEIVVGIRRATFAPLAANEERHASSHRRTRLRRVAAATTGLAGRTAGTARLGRIRRGKPRLRIPPTLRPTGMRRSSAPGRRPGAGALRLASCPCAQRCSRGVAQWCGIAVAMAEFFSCVTIPLCARAPTTSVVGNRVSLLSRREPGYAVTAAQPTPCE